MNRRSLDLGECVGERADHTGIRANQRAANGHRAQRSMDLRIQKAGDQDMEAALAPIDVHWALVAGKWTRHHLDPRTIGKVGDLGDRAAPDDDPAQVRVGVLQHLFDARLGISDRSELLRNRGATGNSQQWRGKQREPRQTHML